MRQTTTPDAEITYLDATKYPVATFVPLEDARGTEIGAHSYDRVQVLEAAGEYAAVGRFEGGNEYQPLEGDVPRELDAVIAWLKSGGGKPI